MHFHLLVYPFNVGRNHNFRVFIAGWVRTLQKCLFITFSLDSDTDSQIARNLTKTLLWVVHCNPLVFNFVFLFVFVVNLSHVKHIRSNQIIFEDSLVVYVDRDLLVLNLRFGLKCVKLG